MVEAVKVPTQGIFIGAEIGKALLQKARQPVVRAGVVVGNEQSSKFARIVREVALHQVPNRSVMAAGEHHGQPRLHVPLW